MPNINITGTIVPDDDAWIYDLFEMQHTAPGTVRSALADSSGQPVTVTINSGGGDVFAGQEIYTLLREYQGDVLIRIQSLAASAAAVIAMARESEISPVAQIMIHNVSARADGDYRDMDHMADVLKTFNESLANAFATKTGKPLAEILDMMNRETWLTADQAVADGFCDRIIPAPSQNTGSQVQLAASIGPGLLPRAVVDYVRKNHSKPADRAKAQAEFEFLTLQGGNKHES